MNYKVIDKETYYRKGVFRHFSEDCKCSTSMTFPGMDNGTGMMSARLYNDDSYRIIPTAIHPGGSIGNHKQNSGDDMNYIISGTGKAFCDGMEEDLKPGVMRICPQGSEHSIVNTGEEDLVMLTIVVKK